MDLNTPPSAVPAGWPAGREVANKLQAYWLVRASRRPPPTPPARWSELVDAIYRRAPFAVLFRLERLGHHLAETAWLGASGRLHGLFTAADTRSLPARSLIPLHVGMGLAFADLELRALPRRASDDQLAAALRRIVAACRDNGRPGYVVPAWEAVGVYVQLFRRRGVPTVGRLLAEVDREAWGCFWHGAGRGIYFLPRHLPPASTRRALDLCRRQPAQGEARALALAGFFFAAAMVNLRQPSALEAVLARASALPGVAAAVAAAMADGVAACSLVRREVTPHDPAIAGLLAHRPSRLAQWDEWVRRPVELALAHPDPLAVASRHLTGLGRERRAPARAGLATAL